MQIGLGLLAVAVNLEGGRGGEETQNKVESDAVSRARAEDVGRPNYPRLHREERHECRDETFRTEFRGAVHRDGEQRPVAFWRIGQASVSVDTASGGVEDAPEPSLPHRLQNGEGGNKRMVEVERRVVYPPRNVGVGGKVED